MPIYEYVCANCSHRFELLIHGSTTVECPECHSNQLTRQFSVFAVNTKSESPAMSSGRCATCGDPRGPGACAVN